MTLVKPTNLRFCVLAAIIIYSTHLEASSLSHRETTAKDNRERSTNGIELDSTTTSATDSTSGLDANGTLDFRTQTPTGFNQFSTKTYTDTSAVTEPTISDVQTTSGNQGEKGDPGSIGPLGPSGPKGDKGDKGDLSKGKVQHDSSRPVRHQQGPPGPPGPMGPPGPIGDPGIPGRAGFNGTDGRRGRRGNLGPKGPKGDTGEPGDPADPLTFDPSNCTCTKGQKGAMGDKGERGLIGFIGYKGEVGEMGPPGPPGPMMEGEPGPPGPSGLPGMRGFKGEKGDAGGSSISGANLILEPESTSPPPATTTSLPTTTTPEPSISPRTKSCRILMVGKPVFQRYTGTYWGSWMKDPSPLPGDEDKLWHTRHFSGQIIYEYASSSDFRQDKYRPFKINDRYYGTGHVVYNGALYYHRAGHNEIVKYNFREETIHAKRHFKGAAHQGLEYLYRTQYNFFDLAIDENGLWVIYAAVNQPDFMQVSKLSPEDLTIEKTWNITVKHTDYGNGFIKCGVLYLIKDTRAKTTVIDFAYDLYTKEYVQNLRLKFTNPFQMNNMVSYNPKENKIYSWDKGNQLTYPLLA